MSWDNSRRRARIAKSGWQQQKDAQRILKLHHRRCHWCSKPGADEVDHVIPLAEGGADTDANKRPIHKACHKAKTRAEAERARPKRKRPPPKHPGLID